MTRNIQLFIQDILDYIERINEYVEGYDLNNFLGDRKTCDSVLRCLEVIGEAAKNIPDEIRGQYPSVPWRDMAGMRDKVIHGYFVVDFEMVWLVIKEDLPTIKPIIKQMLLEMQD
jgi:uncharacterized protein with HEPN domain